MRGASALGSLLAEHPHADVRVLVIWLPVIDSDQGPPSVFVRRPLARDPRVLEFWDPTQWASQQMLARAADDSTRAEGVAWDLVAVYPPGRVWEDPFPMPSWYGRPVVDRIEILDAFLSGATAP